MSHIYIPTKTPDDWQRFLVNPSVQWRTGYSARTLAYCWHAANGFPAEIEQVFAAAGTPWVNADPLLIVPEYKVALEGRGGDSHNDIFVLARSTVGDLLCVMVEGKVNEPFGEPLGKWKAANHGFTDNKQQRLNYLLRELGLAAAPDDVYYQLLHRTASAVIEARRYNARHALMLIHSFSPTAAWFDDYARFLALFGVTAQKDTLQPLTTRGDVVLSAAWVTGDARFLSM